MRLTNQQHQAILSAARNAFGPDVKVRLFGSRTDDKRKGGDFDLYVESDCDDAEWLTSAKLKFLCELDQCIALAGEKVDVVLSTPLHRELRPIDRVARLEGIQL